MADKKKAKKKSSDNSEVSVSVRIPSDAYDLIVKMAEDETRTISAEIGRIIKSEYKRRYGNQ